MPQVGFDPPGEKWQLCLNIVVALPPKPPRLDIRPNCFLDNCLLNLFQIATDVAARGLDIPDVEHVFHYQVPRTSEVCFFVYSSSRNYRGLFMIMHPFLGCGWSVITTAQKSKCRSLLKDIRKRLWFQGVASLTITTFSSSSFSFLFFFERKSSSL